MKKQKIKTGKESILKTFTQKVRAVDQKKIEKASGWITAIGAAGAAVLATAKIFKDIFKVFKKKREG